MEKTKKSRYQRKLFAYFMAVAVIPLCILGMFSYHTAKEALRENIHHGNEAALAQIENKTEKALEMIRIDFLGTAVSPVTQRMINSAYDEIPYPELRDFKDGMGGQESYSDYVKSYSFINLKHGWILGNKGYIPLEDVHNLQWIEILEKNPEKIFWLNETGWNQEGKTDDVARETLTEQQKITPEYISHEYLTLVIKVPTYSEKSDAMFVVSLDQAYMEELFRGSIGNGALLILDPEGNPVYSEDEKLTEAYLDESGEKKADYDIVSRTADMSGWTYVAGYDSRYADGQMNQIIVTMAALILFVFVLLIIMSILGAFRVYQPVKELVSQVKKIVPEQPQAEGEFDLIRQGLHALTNSNEELQTMIRRQKSQLTELFAFRLIRGRMGETEVRESMGRLGLQFQPCLYVVSVLFCKNGRDENTEQIEQDVLNLELSKQLPEEILTMLAIPPFIHTHAIVMVLDGPGKEKLEQKLLALRNCLLVFAGTESGGWLNMGVSRSFEDLSHFRGAYFESLEALKINEHCDRDEDTEGISIEESSVTYYEDLIRQEEEAKRYDLALDTAIKAAVDSCDQKAAFEVVDTFVREVEKRGVALYEQHYYLNRFLLAILTVPADAGIPVHDLFGEEDDPFRQASQLFDYAAIRSFYKKKVVQPVIGRMNQFRKSGSEMILEKVMALIDQKNGDVTLAECAQELGYHPSYIWRVLKNTRDITFTDYIAEQKLRIATRLLEETELSVSEIAERLSYSNAQNFIRLFKKHMGITPGQYRKHRREKAQ